VRVDFYDWFQVGAISAFLVALTVRSALMFARDGVNPFTLVSGKRGVRRANEMLMPPAVLAWIALLFWSVIGGRSDLPAPLDYSVINAEGARILGVALLSISIALFIWALVSFGASWRVGIDEISFGKLVTSGVFSVSRNPIFLSMDLFFVGTFLLQGTVFFLAAAAVAVIATHAQILQEEAFLARTYGAAYADYKSTVPRYLVFGRRLAKAS
jgi:protein-S-isoprenylcysteine O-methyltransferase Ste14